MIDCVLLGISRAEKDGLGWEFDGDGVCKCKAEVVA